VGILAGGIMKQLLRILWLAFALILMCFSHEMYGVESNEQEKRQEGLCTNLVMQGIPFLLAGLGVTSRKARFFSNLHEALNGSENNPTAALIYAARRNYPDIIGPLIQQGADLNHHHNGTYTALHYASFFGYTRVIRELLKYKASTDVVDTDSHVFPVPVLPFDSFTEALASTPYRKLDTLLITPLHCAVRSGCLATVRIFSDHKDLYTLAKNGMTPLNLAIRYGNVPIVRELFFAAATPFGKIKTLVELEESKRRIMTWLLVCNRLQIPKDITKLVVSYMPEDVYNGQMFLQIIPYIQSKTDMRQLLQTCPQLWTKQALNKFSGKLRTSILRGLQKNIQIRVTGFCRKQDASGRRYSDIIQTLPFAEQADGARIRSELSTIFDPENTLNEQGNLIAAYLEEKFKKRIEKQYTH
jgi:Ankyrin repeats (3 copies)